MPSDSLFDRLKIPVGSLLADGALELRANQSDRYQAELKNDIVKRLDRIESLLDGQRAQ